MDQKCDLFSQQSLEFGPFFFLAPHNSTAFISFRVSWRRKSRFCWDLEKENSWLSGEGSCLPTERLALQSQSVLEQEARVFCVIRELNEGKKKKLHKIRKMLHK